MGDSDASKSEVTFLIEEKDFARLMFQPGKLDVVYTDEHGQQTVMPVYRVTAYSGPWHE